MRKPFPKITWWSISSIRYSKTTPFCLLDASGLNIVEPTGKSDSGSQNGQVVKLAG
jgi:hypothetical protein